MNTTTQDLNTPAVHSNVILPNTTGENLHLNITFDVVINTTQGILRDIVHNGTTNDALVPPTPAQIGWNLSAGIHSTVQPANDVTSTHLLDNPLIPSATYQSMHKVFGDQDVNHGHIATATVLTALSLLVVVVSMWIYCRRRASYQHIEEDGYHTADFVYKPLIGGGLDDEYENTFVGVSIPLLQDNTKL